MAIALALAAFAGGALGLVWDWLSGENVPEDEVAAVSEPAADDEEREDEDLAAPSPAPAPAPRPSPNPR